MAPPRNPRVAFLICGGLTGAVREANGDYFDIYSHYCTNMVPPTSNTRVVVDAYDTRNMQYPDEAIIPEFDMIMITGSAASAYENLEWINRLLEFVKHVVKDYPKVRIFGICFGHQIISRVLGGQCVPNGSDGGRWEVGPTTLELTPVAKAIFGVEQLNIQQMHRDHVPLDSMSEALSSGEVHLLGSTDLSGNQGLVKLYPSAANPEEQEHIHPRDIHYITFQGHPEFPEPVITGIVRQRTAAGTMSMTTAEDYLGERGDTGDGVPQNTDGTGRRWWKTNGFDVIGKVCWQMLGVEC